MRKAIAIALIVLVLLVQVVLAVSLVDVDLSISRGVLCITGHLAAYAIILIMYFATPKKSK